MFLQAHQIRPVIFSVYLAADAKNTKEEGIHKDFERGTSFDWTKKTM